ncbi:MAG: helix-turn-helix domain-containing protein [Candidatus Neoclostridium sp.]
MRASNGLSREKFAVLVHIPVANIQTWEQGKSKPPEYVLFLLEEYLKHLPKKEN